MEFLIRVLIRVIEIVFKIIEGTIRGLLTAMIPVIYCFILITSGIIGGVLILRYGLCDDALCYDRVHDAVENCVKFAGYSIALYTAYKVAPLRWGIVTAGKISNDFVNAFNSFPHRGYQAIVAIAARNKNSAAEFAVKHNIPEVYDNYEALAKSNDVDVVYIGALNPYHYDLSKLFLEQGKHVLCEKPLCMNEKQVVSLVNLARKKKLFLMEGVWSRFSPAYVDLEKDIESGKIGDVKFLEVNLGISSDADRINKKEFGGSAVLDVGIYVLQISQFIFKEDPIKVTAVGTLNEHGVDSSETIILEYKGGRRAVLNTHTQLPMWNKATVYGTKGRITLSHPFHFPTEMITCDGTVKRYELHPSKLPYNFQNSAGLVYQTLEVARCVKEGLLESPRMTHKESILMARLEDNVRSQLGVYFDDDNKIYP